jgi:transposase
MPQSYPGIISREQFEKIKPLLESARKKTRPRTLDLYDVFCAVLYLLKSGCQWRLLPRDFPKWQSVYAYFQIWIEQKDGTESILDQALKKIGWRDPHQQWSGYEDELLHYRFPEREEY